MSAAKRGAPPLRHGAWRAALWMAAALGLLSTLGGCPDDDVDQDGGKYYYDGLISEAGHCSTRPTLSNCQQPPNVHSKTHWWCPCPPQNICNGGNPIAVCNESTNDCRYFADSCYPLGYSPCDQNASDRVLGLCGACFFVEAGVRSAYDPLPQVCDQMQRDSGVAQDAPAAP